MTDARQDQVMKSEKMTRCQVAEGLESVLSLNPSSLGGTTHQINPAGGYMVVSASTAKFNEWKRVPPRVVSSRKEGGPGGDNQSQTPRDIKIEAKCLPAGK